jgi:hypothetical protein
LAGRRSIRQVAQGKARTLRPLHSALAKTSMGRGGPPFTSVRFEQDRTPDWRYRHVHLPQARPRTRPLWHIIVDVVNHGTQHRSELALFLTAKGPKEEQGVRFWRRWALAQRAVQAPVVVSLSLPLDQHPGFVQRIEDPVSVARPAVYR